jgi:hypothetical protein
MSAVDVLAVTPAQRTMLVDLARGDGGFDLLDPIAFHASGSLAFRNQDRVIDALKRKGLIDSEGMVTDAGRAALARVGGEA